MLNHTSPKPFVFVLMPFDEDFDDIYQMGIKDACASVGAYCERVDEQMYDERILDRIYNQIAKADIVISDMTGKNPNVFYETGYAHALGKKVILLTKNAEDIPFDLKHFLHIVYEGKIGNLKEELIKRVSWAIENIENSSSVYTPSIRYSIQGVLLKDNVSANVIEYFDHDKKNLHRTLQLDVFNDSEGVIDAKDIQIALITRYYTSSVAAMLPDGRYWHIVPDFGEIFPGSCKSIKINMDLPNGITHKSLSEPGVPAELQEVSRYGRNIIPFNLKLTHLEELEHKVHFT